MGGVSQVEVERHEFEDNGVEADALRETLRQDRTFLVNVMSSPGSGKTTMLVRTIEALKGEFKIGVMEADIESQIDADKIARTGVQAVQMHTGGQCHLDADMTRQGLDGLHAEDYDLVLLENIGSLVTSAEFDTGAAKNVMILSVPEGDDKPLKYPFMFSVCDLILVNKIDMLPYCEFDMDACRERIGKLNQTAPVIPISSRTGEGMDAWLDWLRAEVGAWIGR